MFQLARTLTDLSALSSWDTSSVTNMSYMFYTARALTDLSALSSWDTSSVTNMSYMFQYASALTDASAIDDWDIRAVIATAGNATPSTNNFYYMFYDAPSHPNFTKRLGTWYSGTFVPYANASSTVTVNMDSNIEKVTFSSIYGTQTIKTSGVFIVLQQGLQYTITAIPTSGSTFNSWSTTSGTLGSTTTNPTTYTVTSDSTLTVTSSVSNSPDNQNNSPSQANTNSLNSNFSNLSTSRNLNTNSIDTNDNTNSNNTKPNTTNTYVSPQGVTMTKSNIETGAPLDSGLIIAATTVAMSSIFLFVLAHRHKDDKEDEE